MKRVRGYLLTSALFFTCSFVVAGELGEEIDFLEFLADFHDDDQWIDPLEIEAWGDRRLTKTRSAPRPEPDQELEGINSLESVYDHQHLIEQTPVMDEPDPAADEESYDDD